jgi:acyl-CoA synthetase (AMP-forming)/AMP-acid ligase II
MFYRGTTFSYGDFFDLVNQYAAALKQVGLSKGDEFVACLRLTPDYPVLVGAASLTGTVINLISSDFDKDYIAQIINNSSAKFVLTTDWDLAILEPAFEQLSPRRTVVVLPVDRLAYNGNPYADITDRYYKFDETAYMRARSHMDYLLDADQFISDGKKYSGEINGHGTLDSPLAVTYSSGTTRKGYNKGIIQRNKTYIIMGRYHDHEITGMPSMSKTITLPPVGPHADTTLMSGVSDTMIQGGIMALDPILDEYYFLHSLMINKAGLAIATRTFWLRAMKETYTNPEFKGIKLPYMYVPSEGGEPLSAGEEKALNRWLKDVNAGTAITHTPFSIAKMTIGGGDSEHGSIFVSLFHGYKNFVQFFRGVKEPIGLEYYKFADVAVLRPDGTYCKPMELGHLVANSPISMEKYNNDPDATHKYWVTDAYGKRWGDLSCYGYKDKHENVYVKGRIGKNDPELKTFQIADVISSDWRNIMSCEVVDVNDADGRLCYVAHIEKQYRKKVNLMKTLLAAEKRCYKKWGNELSGRLYFRVRSHEEGFPTTFTAKRDNIALREEGISDRCFIPSVCYKADI